MAVQGLMDASHKEVLSEFMDIVTILESEAFKPSLALLEREGLPKTFAADVRTIVQRYRQARIEQVALNRTHDGEFGSARQAAEEAREWIRYVQGRGRLLVIRKDPLANYIATQLALGDTDLATTLSTEGALEELLHFLETSTDAARLGLEEEQIAEGKRILARIPEEHADAVEARVGREYETKAMREDNELLGQKLEELQLLKELAELRNNTTLPGLEVALLRSAAAARPSKKGEEDGGEGGGGEGGGGTDGGGTGFV